MPLPQPVANIEAVASPAVLVVDDVAANCLAFEAALEPLGGPVVSARSGAEALARVRDGDFAVVLLDVQMPGMDGFETARRIRAERRHVPIVFVTAHDHDAAVVKRAYQLGGVDFLFKPVDIDIVRAKVRVFMDLHERTAQLRRAYEAERQKDEFLAILAHELRNPLAPLRTAIDLLHRDPGRFSAKMLDLLGRQVGQMSRLVDDLLDVSRFMAGKIELRSETVALGDVVEEAITACQPLIDAKHHEVHFTRGATRVAVRGDPVRLHQVFANLVTNAAKYTPPHGRIGVELAVDGATVIVRVSDTGRGIPPELLDRVFDMFVQERVGLDGEGGLGLGLALVRRLTELHGGVVAVSSAGVGQGSCFEVRLPAIGTTELRTTLRNLPLTLPSPVRGLRAIVVDDDDDLREVLADLLTSCGHEVVTAGDARAALAMMRERTPDVALVDIGLPGVDGYQLARELRGDDACRNVRLIAVTGRGSESDIACARAAGFDAHLVKPATAAAILQVLARSK